MHSHGICVCLPEQRRSELYLHVGVSQRSYHRGSLCKHKQVLGLRKSLLRGLLIFLFYTCAIVANQQLLYR